MRTADDLPDIATGLTSLEWRVLRAMPRVFTKTSKVLRAVVETEVPSLEEHLDRERWWEAIERPTDAVGLAEYAAIVRLALPFRSRYPLVEYQGWFGTFEGSAPADHFYNSCRLSPLGIDVLEGRAPNALLNGAPSFLLPHHAADVARVLELVAARPAAPLDELIDAIVGPDLATGGIIEDAAPLRKFYGGAAVSIRVRARVEMERDTLEVRDVPFGIRTADVIEQLYQPQSANSMVNDIAHTDGGLVLKLRPNVNAIHARASFEHHPVFARTIDVDPLVRVNGEARRVDLRELARAYLERAAPGQDAIMALAELDKFPRRTRIG